MPASPTKCVIVPELEKLGVLNETTLDGIVRTMRRLFDGVPDKALDLLLTHGPKGTAKDLAGIIVARARMEDTVNNARLFHKELIRNKASKEQLHDHQRIVKEMTEDLRAMESDVVVFQSLFDAVGRATDPKSLKAFSEELVNYLGKQRRNHQRLALKYDTWGSLANAGLLGFSKNKFVNMIRSLDKIAFNKIGYKDVAGKTARQYDSRLVDFIHRNVFRDNVEKVGLGFLHRSQHWIQAEQKKLIGLMPLLSKLDQKYHEPLYQYFRKWFNLDAQERVMAPLRQFDADIKSLQANIKELKTSKKNKDRIREIEKEIAVLREQKKQFVQSVDVKQLREQAKETNLPALRQQIENIMGKDVADKAKLKKNVDEVIKTVEDIDQIFWKYGNEMVNLGLMDKSQLFSGYILQAWEGKGFGEGGSAGYWQPLLESYRSGRDRTNARGIEILPDKMFAQRYPGLNFKDAKVELPKNERGQTVMPFSKAKDRGLELDVPALVAKAATQEAKLVAYSKMFQKLETMAKEMGLTKDPNFRPAGYRRIEAAGKSLGDYISKLKGDVDLIRDYYFPAEIALSIDRMLLMPGDLKRFWKDGTRWWKQSKTVWNYGTHARQDMTNLFLLAPLAGHISPVRLFRRLSASTKLLFKHPDSDFMRILMEEGGLFTDFYSSDMAKYAPKTKDIKSYGDYRDFVNEWRRNIMQFGTDAHRAHARAYMFGDQVFRVAHMLKYLEERNIIDPKKLPTDSIKDEVVFRQLIRQGIQDTNKHWPNYSEVPPMIHAASDIIPFIKWDWEAARIIGSSFLRPFGLAWRGDAMGAARATLPPMLVMSFATAMLQLEKEWAEDMGLSEDYLKLKGKAATGWQVLVPQGVSMALGTDKPLALDLTYIVPYGDLVAMSEELGMGMGGKKFVFNRLTSHPIFLATDLAGNRQRFNGARTADEDAPFARQAAQYAQFFTYQMLPTWVSMVGRDYLHPVFRYMDDRAPVNVFGGDQKQLYTNVGTFAGLRFSELPENGIKRFINTTRKYDVQEVKSNITKLRRRLAQNRITQRRYDKEIKIELDKYRRLMERGSLHGARLWGESKTLDFLKE